jgi:hypothetical protein
MTTEKNFVSESTMDQLAINNQNDLNYCVNFRNLDSKITDLINNSNDTKLKEDWILTKSTLKYAEEKANENKNDKNEEILNKKRKRECEEDFSIFDENLLINRLYCFENRNYFVSTYPIYINRRNITKINLTGYHETCKIVRYMLNITGISYRGSSIKYLIFELVDKDINKLIKAHEKFNKNLDKILELFGLF